MRTVGVKLIADIAQFEAKMRQAQKSTKDFVGEMDRAAKGGNLDAVADQVGMLGLGMVGAAGMVVKSAAEFEKAMSGVKAATHASAGEMDALKAAALEAGKSTSFSATEAAGAITELSKAGVATADVLGGGLKGALDLAAAGQLDVGEAAETAASAMTMFKLKGKDVPHIADLLSAAAGKAQGSVHDMGAALNQAGLVASQMGLSIEDTTGTLAAFASNGLLGSDAGTSLKTAMLMLANPTDKAAGLMEELGIQTYDASGKFVGIANLAGQLKTQLGGLTQEQRNAALATIFGSDAIRAASILYEQGQEGIQGWITKVNDAGFASETAKTQTDNLVGDLDRLRGSLETLAIESGGGANSGLRVLAQAANALVDQIGLLPSGVTGAITVLTALGGVLALGAAGWVKMRSANAAALEELRSTGPAGQRAAAGMQATTKWAGRAAAGFAALEIASAAVGAAISDMNPQVDALAVGLQRFVSTGDVGGEAARLLGGDMSMLDTAMKDVADTGRWSSFARGFASAMESVPGAAEGFDDSLYNSKQRLEAVDQALQQLVSGGNAAQAAQVFSSLAERAKEQGVSVEELKKVLPGYAASLETAAGAAAGAADATGKIPGPTGEATEATKEYASAAEAAAAAANGQREALTQLSDMIKAESDPVFALTAAQRDLEKAHKAAADATRKHGGNSAEAQEATQKLAEAAIELQGRVGALGGAFNGQLSPALIQTLRAAGLTERQIADVSAIFRQAKRDGDAFAKNYKAPTSAPGAAQAARDVRGLRTEVSKLYGKTITVGVRYSATGLERVNAAGNRIGGYKATGGAIIGPGTGTSDSVPMNLSTGEHVWTAKEVKAAGGHSAVEAMRAGVLGAPVQQMAGGGPVTPARVMPAAAQAQRVIVETRNVVEFGGNAGQFGELMLHVLRVKPGVREAMKQRLGVKA